jgi:hypothetical protein
MNWAMLTVFFGRARLQVLVGSNQWHFHESALARLRRRAERASSHFAVKTHRPELDSTCWTAACRIARKSILSTALTPILPILQVPVEFDLGFLLMSAHILSRYCSVPLGFEHKRSRIRVPTHLPEPQDV